MEATQGGLEPGASAAEDCHLSVYPRAARGRLSQVERATIWATLEECRGNRTHAAKKLGISRRALIYKLRAIEAESG